MTPRWRLYRNERGNWSVRHSLRVECESYPSWQIAVSALVSSVSRWAIDSVLHRAAEAPGECEGVEACLITGATLRQKRTRILDAAHRRGLSVQTWAEKEDDPRDTTIYVQVKGKRA